MKIQKIKIVFNKPLPTSFDLLDDPMLAIGEAYMDDLVDFDEVMIMAEKNKQFMKDKNEKILKGTTKLISKVSFKDEQKENIQYHYDLGNDFFHYG